MGIVRPYVITIVGIAVLSAILEQFVTQSATKNIIRMLCGVLMTLTLLTPLTKRGVVQFSDILSAYSLDAQEVSAEGETYFNEELSRIIKVNSEAYILDKAKQMGAQLQVNISCSGEDPPKPCQIEISGNVSPYVRNQLQIVIEEELGITKENQIWM